jgi:hypothetical protein
MKSQEVGLRMNVLHSTLSGYPSKLKMFCTFNVLAFVRTRIVDLEFYVLRFLFVKMNEWNSRDFHVFIELRTQNRSLSQNATGASYGPSSSTGSYAPRIFFP